MAGTTMVEQVHKGMQVRSSDGKRLGKVSRVWFGDAEAYIEVLLVPPWKAFLMAGADADAALYIPAGAIEAVSKQALGSRVTLKVTAEAARAMVERPKGIEVQKGRDTRGPWSGGGLP